MNKDFFHCTIGTLTPLVAVLTSFQENIEFWLRISGLIVGLIVGLASLWKIITKP
jgi:hypothetical protein